MNDELINDLHNATKPSIDEEGRQLLARRKDMVGIGANLDRHATTALRTNRKEHATKEQKKLLDLDFKKNPLVILDSILAGSVRGNARL